MSDVKFVFAGQARNMHRGQMLSCSIRRVVTDPIQGSVPVLQLEVYSVGDDAEETTRMKRLSREALLPYSVLWMVGSAEWEDFTGWIDEFLPDAAKDYEDALSAIQERQKQIDQDLVDLPGPAAVGDFHFQPLRPGAQARRELLLAEQRELEGRLTELRKGYQP